MSGDAQALEAVQLCLQSARSLQSGDAQTALDLALQADALGTAAGAAYLACVRPRRVRSPVR